MHVAHQHPILNAFGSFGDGATMAYPSDKPYFAGTMLRLVLDLVYKRRPAGSAAVRSNPFFPNPNLAVSLNP